MPGKHTPTQEVHKGSRGTTGCGVNTHLKQAESVITFVSMANSGLNTYICFLSILIPQKLTSEERTLSLQSYFF